MILFIKVNHIVHKQLYMIKQTAEATHDFIESDSIRDTGEHVLVL